MSEFFNKVDWDWYHENWNDKAMRMRGDGLNIAQIARRMTELGFCTKGGNMVTPRMLGASLKSAGLIPFGEPGKRQTYTPEQRQKIRGVILECRVRGEGASRIAGELNSRGIKTFQGKTWDSTSVMNYARRNKLRAEDLQQEINTIRVERADDVF